MQDYLHDQKEKDPNPENKQDYQDFIDKLKSLIYYMFLAGVYHDGPEDQDTKDISNVNGYYFWKTWGYLLVFILCLFERIWLQWLIDRFGCTPNIYQ